MIRIGFGVYSTVITTRNPQTPIRIIAAEGGVQSAAEMLDEMNRTSVQTNIAHVTSAIRACREAEGSSYNAAKFLLDMSLEMGLEPNIATFTSLMGAYSGAKLEMVMEASGHMKSLKIKPNNPFTEVYLTTVLDIKRGEGRYIRSVQDALALLRDRPPARLEAARAAVSDFRAANIDITSLGLKFVRALKLLQSSEPWAATNTTPQTLSPKKP